MSDLEKVELAEDTLDQIAERVAGLVAAKPEPTEDPQIKALRDELAELKAQRSTIADAGPAPKPGEAPVITGGDDMFTLAGDDAGETAVNLFIARKMLNVVGRDLSPRGKQVMLASGEAALKAGPRPFVQKGTDTTVIKSQYATEIAAARKALTSTGANAGDDWVPTFASAELWRDTHLATQVTALIRRVDMPTNPYDLPTQTADATFRYASSENTAVTASNFTTNKATLTAVKIQAEVDFSGEVTEDSIVPIAAAIRADLVRRGAQTMDDLIVHGDTETGGTGNVNSDNGAPTAGSFYLALNGLRKFAVVTNSGQTSNVSAALSSSNFGTIRALLGKYGARPSDLAIVTGTSTYLPMQQIAEVITPDKYGAGATVLTGELARFFNIPIFLSEAIPGQTWDKVEADGKSNTTAGTLGWLVLFNRNHWVAGFRRGFQIESFRDIQKDQNILVASFRMALTSSGIATTHTASGRNITV